MTLPSVQKALFLTEKHGKFAVSSTEVPKPGAGELLVRIQSTALNPIDWKIQETGYFVDDYPAILGSDSAGTVAAVGDGVTRFVVGDKVFHQGTFTNRQATFQEYSIIAEEIAAKVPANITFDQAATIPVGLDTATIGLYGKKWEGGGAELSPPWLDSGRGKYTGQPIIIFAGSSSVGQYAIQLAKLSGFSPIITTVSPYNNDLVKSLGATHPLNRKLPVSTLPEAIRAVTSKPIKIIYDAFGADPALSNVAYDLLASGGTLVTVLPPSVDQDKITPKKHIITTYGSPYPPENREVGKELYANITRLLESGEVKPNVVEYAAGGLASIPAQLERLKNNEISGKKIVVRPPETE